MTKIFNLEYYLWRLAGKSVFERSEFDLPSVFWLLFWAMQKSNGPKVITSVIQVNE